MRIQILAWQTVGNCPQKDCKNGVNNSWKQEFLMVQIGTTPGHR